MTFNPIGLSTNTKGWRVPGPEALDFASSMLTESHNIKRKTKPQLPRWTEHILRNFSFPWKHTNSTKRSHLSFFFLYKINSGGEQQVVTAESLRSWRVNSKSLSRSCGKQIAPTQRGGKLTMGLWNWDEELSRSTWAGKKAIMQTSPFHSMEGRLSATQGKYLGLGGIGTSRACKLNNGHEVIRWL